MPDFIHQPVMLGEVLAALALPPDGRVVDGTLGSGGHAQAMLERLGLGGRLLALDRDTDALARGRARLERFGDRACFAHGNLADVAALARAAGFDGVQGVLFDLGVSSDQLDTPGRGFSFQQDGPLDMRMDRTRGPDAAEWVATAAVPEMIRVFREFGEEPMASAVARAIDRERAREPVLTTLRFAEIVSRAKGGRRGRTHPATQVFQAVRMAVNRELESVAAGLAGALDLLAPGGRLAVITFHSLEDRLVKHFFAAHEGREVSLQQGGSEWQGDLPRVRRVTRKPVTASDEELAANPRARSAKLRTVEKT